ncbi:hypothetical protein D3C81_1948820 [compost metagenome]
MADLLTALPDKSNHSNQLITLRKAAQSELSLRWLQPAPRGVYRHFLLRFIGTQKSLRMIQQ